LGEHEGLALHGISLFNEETHVPLIVVPPWPRQRSNVLDVVSLVDLAPTIVKLAGLTPPPTFVGRSLDAYLQRQPGPNSVSASRGAFSSLAQLRRGKNEVTPLQRILHRTAYVRGAKKLLESSDGVLQMYGIDEDHLEFDLRTVGPDDQAMKRAYESAVKVAGANATKAEVAPIDQAMLEQLKALGYSD
jgi:arylsulfatase A-like enzyme